jgi:hypothetical protein
VHPPTVSGTEVRSVRLVGAVCAPKPNLWPISGAPTRRRGCVPAVGQMIVRTLHVGLQDIGDLPQLCLYALVPCARAGSGILVKKSTTMSPPLLGTCTTRCHSPARFRAVIAVTPAVWHSYSGASCRLDVSVSCPRLAVPCSLTAGVVTSSALCPTFLFLVAIAIADNIQHPHISTNAYSLIQSQRRP